MHRQKEFCGSTTVGEKGQIVLPSNLREKMGIKKGDKFLVLCGPRGGILLINAEMMTKHLSHILGDDVEIVLKKDKE
jgi:AbrB family looped-hinge helix DNA binding protein